MKKTPKMIRVGMLLALGLPLAAQAGVEVYGQARPSVDFVSNNTDVPGDKDTKLSLSSNASRIGFKGDEDLGNGLALKWQLENQVDFDTGVAFAKQRNTFVGVGGGFGTVLAGKLDTPYKSSTQYLDIFVDTVADFSAVMNYGHDLRVGNTLAYVTPDMNGFKGSAAYVMSIANGDDNLPISTANDKKDAFSLSGNYSNGPLSLVAAYETLSQQGAGGDDANAWKIGGSYTIMDATTVGLIYENTDVAGTTKDRNAFYLNAAHKMGDTTLKLAYGNIDKCGGSAGVCDQTGASQMSVGASQALTKNTEVYALYTMVSNDDNASFALLGKEAGVVTGKDMSAFSVGINHMFSSK